MKGGIKMHNKHRQGDEWYCDKCGRTWNVDDTDPEECNDTGLKPEVLPRRWKSSIDEVGEIKPEAWQNLKNSLRDQNV